MATAKTATVRKRPRPAGVPASKGKGAVMAPPAVPAEERVILHGIRWETYESLLKDLENCRTPRLTYDRGTLEIMSPLPDHEKVIPNLVLLVEFAAEARRLDICGLGSTTFRREDLQRGFEPDACYYVQHAAEMRSKSRIDLTVDPPPDLVIEIDLTHSTLDKLPIYAQIGVPEVWRHSGQRVAILILQSGTYQEQEESAVLPGVKAADLTALLEEAVALARPEWMQKAREWARGEPR